ncbi:MAG TPA: superoxide dismutase, Ni [Candidatus Saccharimonadales bacterium]|nr:superoxide dismutase, Ni [Candidatus Saccharimonadales bacterium]
MIRKIILSIGKLLPSQTVYAHCDVPCGIYDPKAAQTAAATVARMVELIEGIENDTPSVEDRAKFVRCVMTKEEHAQKCKTELLILWTDYFKPEHLEMFPNLHETFWKAAKLCSENKQHISKDAAQNLISAVDEIAEMFAKTKAPKK